MSNNDHGPVYYIVTWGQLPGDNHIHHLLLDIIPCYKIRLKTEEYIMSLNLNIWGVIAARHPNRHWLSRREFEDIFGEVPYP